MKRIYQILFLFAILLANKAIAQREPQITHYMLNKLVYNPAFAGTQGNNICASLLYHNQWGNFKSTEDESKAPISMFFNAHAPLQVGGKDIGVGLQVLNDQLGFENRTEVRGMGAYHMKTKYGLLSSGLSVAMNQISLDGKWLSENPDDPLIKNGAITQSTIDVGVGAYLTDPKYNVGFSLLHVNSPSLEWGTQSKVPRVLYLHGGYNYRVPNTKIDLIPSGLYRYDFAKMQISLSTLAQYDNKFFAGLNYHSGDALSLIAGLNWNDITFSYAYDITVSDASPFGGKHEVFVKYCFKLNLLPREINSHKSSRFL